MENGWPIYAHVLELLSSAFWWSVGVAVVVGFTATAVADPVTGVLLGSVAAMFVWPVLFSRKADEIRVDLARQKAANVEE